MAIIPLVAGAVAAVGKMAVKAYKKSNIKAKGAAKTKTQKQIDKSNSVKEAVKTGKGTDGAKSAKAGTGNKPKLTGKDD